MLTGKQRAYLRAIANRTEALYICGKGGISENLIKTFSDGLESREIIKITVLETCPDTPREVCAALCEALSADPVQVIGRKIVLYRESRDNRKIELPE